MYDLLLMFFFVHFQIIVCCHIFYITFVSNRSLNFKTHYLSNFNMYVKISIYLKNICLCKMYDLLNEYSDSMTRFPDHIII